MPRFPAVILSFLLILLSGEALMSLSLTSDSFADGEPIPVHHTCQGADLSPALTWSDVPPGTKSLVLIVDDPDAPDPAAPKRTWVHWVLYNIPPTATFLSEGILPADLPEGTRQGRNDVGSTGYHGPCPPIGTHRYFHKLYALDAVLNLSGRPDKAAVVAAMEGHVLAEAVLMGTYRKGE